MFWFLDNLPFLLCFSVKSGFPFLFSKTKFRMVRPVFREQRESLSPQRIIDLGNLLASVSGLRSLAVDSAVFPIHFILLKKSYVLWIHPAIQHQEDVQASLFFCVVKVLSDFFNRENNRVFERNGDGKLLACQVAGQFNKPLLPSAANE